MAEAIIAVGCFILGIPVGMAIGVSYRKPKTKVVVAAKRVDNRLMPNYTRAQRREHKRRHRG